MHTRALSTRCFRSALILTAVALAAAVTPLPAQQALDSARVVPASPAPAVSPSTTLPGPRVSPRFQSFEPRLAPSSVSRESSVAAQGGQHTIVFSTLALVLAVIIIVLLVVK